MKFVFIVLLNLITINSFALSEHEVQNCQPPKGKQAKQIAMFNSKARMFSEEFREKVLIENMGMIRNIAENCSELRALLAKYSTRLYYAASEFEKVVNDIENL